MRYITDNVLKDITFDEKFLIDLFNAKEFKRLNRINQLGLTNFLFPGANHTRLSHSLGAYELSNRFVKKFIEKGYKIDKLTHQAVVSAALLHDIGHGPFSHLFEKITEINHEKWSIAIITNENTEVNKILKKQNPKLPSMISDILTGKFKPEWASQLVSSEIDVDRLDYLLRDSYSIGLNYGNIEYKWLLRNSIIVNDKLAFNKKAIPTIEAMILGRYHMNKIVYNSAKNVACSILFKWFFNRLKFCYLNKNLKFNYDHFIPLFKKEKMSVEQYLDLDDYLVWSYIRKASTEDDDILKKISNNLLLQKRAEIVKIEDLNKDKNTENFTWEIVDIKSELHFYQSNKNSKEALIAFDNNKLIKLRDLSTVINNKVNDVSNIKAEKIGLRL